MAPDEVRLWGDPLCRSPRSVALRDLLQRAASAGVRCGLCLSGAVGEAAGRPIAVTDGVTSRSLHTALDDAALVGVLAAERRPVAATAPLVVFGDADDAVTASLEFPRACAVLTADPARVTDLLAAIRESSREARRRADGADSPLAFAQSDLAPFFELAPAGDAHHAVHVGGRDPHYGSDVAVRAFAQVGTGRMTVLLAQADPALEERLRGLAAREAAGPVDLRFSIGRWSADVLAALDAGIVFLPAREFGDLSVLATALASGRTVVATRFGTSASLLASPGICLPIGGRVRGAPRPGLEPDLRAAVRQLRAALDGPIGEQGKRGRDHVWSLHRAGQPAAPRPRAAARRPLVVLEAPLFEQSSSAELTLHTARALAARGRVDLRLVARAPLRRSIAWLRERAPSLEPLLDRAPPPADLWLSAGWPPRPDRPLARCFAVRFDWEWGALPVEWAPLLVDEADRVIVHSRAVRRVLTAAGRPPATIERVPHGVDAAVFHENAPALQRVVDFKGDRTALLFVGGLIWRKGIDLLLSAVLQSADPRRLCLVIKSVGAADAYAGYHMAELIERVRAMPGAPAVAVLDEDLTPAEMAGLYRACDLLVHPYRGEGFGMPVLEARACGLPVLVTAGGSTDDFCADIDRIPAARRRVELPDVHVSAPWVLEPDTAQLAELLGRALRELPEWTDRARAAARIVRAEHTWSAAANRIERLAFASTAAPLRGPIDAERSAARLAVAGCDTVGSHPAMSVNSPSQGAFVAGR